jgi:diadenosine tetraphosphate (Ap4A) HIT family hydrolase
MGNGVAHLHWHLIPRPHDDPGPTGPVYFIPWKIWRSPETRPSPEALGEIKAGMLAKLIELGGEEAIVRSYRGSA